MKINWFSPLPPSKTAIADYTRHVLAALAARSDVVIWTDQAQWDSSVEAFGEVRRYGKRPCWRELNKADVTFYNMGNNAAFHGPLWEVSRQMAGIVILHDAHLQHLFTGLYKRAWDRPEAYRAVMAHHYGLAGLEAADTYLAGRLPMEQLAERFPLTPFVLENALAAIVHVPADFEQLSRDWQRPVCYAPLPYASSPVAVGADMRVAEGTNEGPPYRLVMFGYLGPNRRLEAVLQALATFPDRDKFQLHVYGHLDKPDRWRTRIQGLGLSGSVTLHGFVPETELEQALASMHLAINLRYPTMGEASWSQLQLWHHALPSLVTRTGWYETISEEAVAFVRPAHEVADIHGHLADFLEDPPRFAQQGRAGRRILRRDHLPETYADALIDFARQVQPHRGRVNAFTLVERTAAVLRDWTSSEDSAPMLNRFAREIRDLTAA